MVSELKKTMLPGTGYFKTMPCPFFDSGFCERPFCHFRHVRRGVLSRLSDMLRVTSHDSLYLHFCYVESLFIVSIYQHSKVCFLRWLPVCSPDERDVLPALACSSRWKTYVIFACHRCPSKDWWAVSVASVYQCDGKYCTYVLPL
jgi:hypothetical protein